MNASNKTTTAFVLLMIDDSYRIAHSDADIWLTPGVRRATSVTVDRGESQDETTARLIEAGKWCFDRGMGMQVS